MIDCLFLDFNDDRWGLRSLRIVIPEYSGTRSITPLDAVPVRLLFDLANVETDIMDCGRRFVDSAMDIHRIYTGFSHLDKWLETSRYEVSWTPASF